jgi:GT2 family glycosyltransferase
MTTKTTEVSIVTVGMNHISYLKDFFHSLYYTAKPLVTFEVIYIDNCSKDGSVEFVTANFPEVKVMQNKKPQGFARNNNLGVKHSTGKYIAIINPDVIFTPLCIDHLHRYLNDNNNIGILVPKLLNKDMTVQYSVRRFIDLKTLLTRIFYMGNDKVYSELTDKYLLKDFDTELIQKVDWAIGAAMFLEKTTFDKLNGFDEDYYLYVEDEDLCLRSWKKNLPVYYLPTSIMIHAHQKSSNKVIFGKKMRMHFNSMVIFFFKHNILFKSYSFMDK